MPDPSPEVLPVPSLGPVWHGSDPSDDVEPLRLVLRSTGQAIELNRPEVVAGRHSGADLCLPMADVSRHHCRFVFHEGQWEIHDLHSLNGSFVNDQPVEHAVLHHQDVLRVGGFLFDVELPAAGTGEDGAPGVLRSIVEALPRPTRQAS